ncbi:hypothetical protein CYMTET_16855, partial [Cymbomonas tetramitiformis]
PLLPLPGGGGRARLVLRYGDGSWQSVHMYVLAQPLAQHVAAYGDFSANTMWLPANDTDPFARGASVMPWDREGRRHVLQDGRAFIVGLSDDAGAGANLGLATKVMYAPVEGEVRRVDDYIALTLNGQKNGSHLAKPHFSLQSPTSHRIRMTVFYFRYSSGYKKPWIPGWRTLDSHGSPAGALSFHCSEQYSYPGQPDYYTESNYRQYNFPHQIASYYAMYRAARHLDLLARPLRRSWDWYLDQAAVTLLTLGCWNHAFTDGRLTCIPSVGLMDGTIFREVLLALKFEAAATEPPPSSSSSSSLDDLPTRNEGLLPGSSLDHHRGGIKARASRSRQLTDVSTSTARNVTASTPALSPPWGEYATLIEGMMFNRTVSGINGHPGWAEQDFPYGSEFNWDTTGQEEVAVWGAYFNATSEDQFKGELNARAVDAILAFMPSVPNWAYNGAAGGWGDFSNNAKWMVTGGWEREGGHYRAGLNSIPLIERYRAYPDDFYLLEVGMAGITNTLPNIDAEGAPSMGFHLHPFMLEHDPYSGDYGLAFFGQSMNVGAYVVRHAELGWLCFLCNLLEGVRELTIIPADTYHRRVYLEPLGLYITLETGTFASFAVDLGRSRMTLQLVTAPKPQGSLGSPQGTKRATPLFTKYRLKLETPALASGSRHATNFLVVKPAQAPEKGGVYEIPVSQVSGFESTEVEITWTDS